MKNLKSDIKAGTFKPVYLLFGEERYLVDYYARVLTDAALAGADRLMNHDAFEGKGVPVRHILDAAETLPFLSEKRVVQVRDSRLFAAGRKADSEALAEYLAAVPETAVLVFVEDDVDKRGRPYKKAAEFGRAAECKTPSESELLVWLGHVFQKRGKRINAAAAGKLLRTVLRDMNALYAEADKLASYTGERAEITEADVDAACSPSLEARVFDLTAALGGGRAGEALSICHTLFYAKEPPVVILAMMARQFRLMLQCKNAAAQKKPAAVIAQELGLRGFIADECLRQGRAFTAERLLTALQDCGEADVRMKTGLIQAETALEVLIARYASPQ